MHVVRDRPKNFYSNNSVKCHPMLLLVCTAVNSLFLAPCSILGNVLFAVPLVCGLSVNNTLISILAKALFRTYSLGPKAKLKNRFVSKLPRTLVVGCALVSLQIRNIILFLFFYFF